MELFTVNRYNDTTNVPDDPNKEQKILEKLQKKIKKKKRQLNESNKIVEENNSAPQDNDNDVNIKSTDENDANRIQNNDENKVEQGLLEENNKTPQNPTDESLILGHEQFTKRQKISMVLPSWLAYPVVMSSDLNAPGPPIESLEFISPSLKNTLRQMSVLHLFPVQQTVIPWILTAHKKPLPFRPRDACISAPTGSGKTLAYAVPIVQILSQRLDQKVRALIILPVNELAVQVLEVFKKLCHPIGLSCILLSKLGQFDKEQQQLVGQFNGKFYSKVDIVIATTGRLVAHIHSTTGFSLKYLQFLVVDEADRILEQIQDNWLYHLDNHVQESSNALIHGPSVPLCYRELCDYSVKQPHKLLFSATLSQDPEKLQTLGLFQPKLFTSIVRPFSDGTIEIANNNTATNTSITRTEIRGEFIGKFTTPAELTEKYCLTQPEIKPLTLYALIMENKWTKFLCFTNSGEAAHRLSYVLQYLLGADKKIEELSSGLPTHVRNDVLQKLKTDKVDGLICSDALARGIDIPDVKVVISYEAPRHVKTYIHRIGRTARAGRTGLAVTILTSSELNSFNKIIAESGKTKVLELKLNDNLDELKARDYAKAVEHMQKALKREENHRTVRSVNEKFKEQKFKDCDKTAGGLIEKLQAQIQQTAPRSLASEWNLPESWKWQHQQQINLRKERKRKKKHKTK